MEFDPLLLSRLQFAANISFHILFPTLTIGLCWLLLFFRVRYTQTGDKAWEFAYFFWVKIFALNFALGVVTGITMSFQFGTNWPGFMERVGNIAGPLLGYEVLTAFFLEATFLGIMLFGKSRVSNRMHLIATSMVAIGTTFSAFWILSLNSWMQTPAGHSIENGVFYVDSWMAVLFNPSFLFRLAHMVTACLLTAAFFVAGVSAWRILKRVDGPATYHALRSAIVMAALLSPLQIFIGDLHGLNTFEHQPAKIAAMEAVWETDTEVPFTLFGFPDEETRSTHAAIEIPYLGSLILTHDIHGEVRGLNDFIGEHPPVSIVFWSFRVMVGIGMLMLLVSWWSLSRIYRKQDFSRFHLQTLAVMTISGWVAVLAGWFVTEIGRQPWMVYNLIRVDELVAEHGSGILLTTLVTYALLYLFLTFSYISAMFYLASQPSPVVD
ncbi:MAG: cytochrome ubiquinol oxidase subunit I [Gammaproteobacteria bacterium]|nr:cytochrome ubiquinol oxidase subunit I [Gammaproteobacteria bacterium]